MQQSWLIWWKRDDQVIANSMRWWAGSIIQGIVYSLGPIFLGGTLLVLSSITNDVNMLVVAVALLVVGAGYISWYTAAPHTRKWEVVVTDDSYYVVEDDQGGVFGYLGQGLNRVPWRRDVCVRKFADFKTIPVYEQFDDIYWTDGTKGYVEIKMTMRFDPTQAEPIMYKELRKMNQRDAFGDLIRNDLRDFLQYQSKMLAWDELGFLVGNSKTIQGAIIDGLEPLAAIGLTPAEDRPILILLDAEQPAVEEQL
ncbi:MAG: hypothetical protein JXA10_09695 [Anaerolineae bacterium]|nr:hypothetical protein [Anaerolineae bacterium]